MDNRMNPERAAGTAEPEHQGPKPVPYTYHDGREDYLHVGRREGTESDQPEALVPPSERVNSPVHATALPPGAASVAAEVITSPPEATALPPVATPRAAAQRPQQALRMSEIVTRGLRTGAVLTAATMCTMMAASTLKRGSPWAAMNAMAAVGLGGRRVKDRFDPVATPAGIAVLAGGMLVWAIGYEKALDAAGRRSSALTGTLSAIGGFLLDDLVMPDRLMKGFRDKMGVLGTVGKYVALGVASAAAPR